MNALGRILLVLVCAQFIITIDTTFMNVSLSTLVVDLDTTVTGVQSAITLYALIMAALMIAGAKFGDIIGRKRAFIAGLLIYATGTTITSLASSLPVFLFGWSFLEGAGAALMLPAMMSLIADNFPAGPQRAKAYAAFAATAGVAAALGPVVGGLFTTYLSWRLAFASELVVALFILSQRRLIREQPRTGPKPLFDWPGFGLSALGLVVMVQGIILASSYGLLRARADWGFGDTVLISAGQLSPTVWLAAIGIIILAAFYLVEYRRNAAGKQTLVSLDIFRLRAVGAGSVTQMMQAFVLTGIIFALSLFVQMELGYNAIQSGLTLLPLSFGVLGFSFIAGRMLSKRYPPRNIILAGFMSIVFGALAMGYLARDAAMGLDFAAGLLFLGAGIGMVVSQNQNLIISAVKPSQTNEASGIVNTFQNIGSSLGTSLAGAVIIAVLVATATSLVATSAVFTGAEKTTLDQTITTKAQVVSNQQLETATQNLPSAQQGELVSINSQARKRALTVVYAAIGIVGLVGLVSAYRLPRTEPLGT